MIVGNKVDMDKDGAVVDAARDFAATHDLYHTVISAKTNFGVRAAFVGMARVLMRHQRRHPVQQASQGEGEVTRKTSGKWKSLLSGGGGRRRHGSDCCKTS